MKNLLRINSIFSEKRIVKNLEQLNCVESGIITCINPHSIIVSLSDPDFYNAIRRSNYLLLDGIGAYFYAKTLGLKVRRITGSDYFSYWQKNLSENKKVLFIGSTENTLRKIKERFENDCLKIGSCSTFSPDFKNTFTCEDAEAWSKSIDLNSYDVIFLGLTAPKQEKIAILLKRYLSHRTTIISIGAVFDYYAETKRKPNKVIKKLGLEWCHRLFLEPRRMFKRVFVTGACFFVFFVINTLRRNLLATYTDKRRHDP